MIIKSFLQQIKIYHQMIMMMIIKNLVMMNVEQKKFKNHIIYLLIHMKKMQNYIKQINQNGIQLCRYMQLNTFGTAQCWDQDFMQKYVIRKEDQVKTINRIL